MQITITLDETNPYVEGQRYERARDAAETLFHRLAAAQLELYPNMLNVDAPPLTAPIVISTPREGPVTIGTFSVVL